MLDGVLDCATGTGLDWPVANMAGLCTRTTWDVFVPQHPF